MSGGTGLGLNIVREIARGHGWTVELTESADSGARFEFAGVERGNRTGRPARRVEATADSGR